MYCGSEPTIIANNFVSENNAELQGCGIECICRATIAGNTITYNTPLNPQYFTGGGGIYVNSDYLGPAEIGNNIIAFNRSGIQWSGTRPEDSPVLTRNCVYSNNNQDYLGLPPGPSDIHVDPMLDPAIPWRLLADSPCIDEGENSCVVGAADIEGNPRIYNDTVDIGAHEYQP